MKQKVDFSLIHDLYHASQKLPKLGPRLFDEINALYLNGEAYIKVENQIIKFNMAQLRYPYEMAAVRRRDLLN
jgi:hypothetical protein